jgi:hypothetical protein
LGISIIQFTNPLLGIICDAACPTSTVTGRRSCSSGITLFPNDIYPVDDGVVSIIRIVANLPVVGIAIPYDSLMLVTGVVEMVQLDLAALPLFVHPLIK